MLRWFFLFAAFSVIFGSAVLVWWRLDSEKRRQRVVRSLASNVNPADRVSTTVLAGRPDAATGLASRLKARIFPGEAGGEAGQGKLRFVLLSLGATVAGFMLGTKFTGIIGIAAPFIGGAAAGAIPWVYRAKRRDRRLGAIEEQFPEVLDFLARSVRAGNAFSIALELVAGEAGEPLKSEFLKLTREIALGAGLDDALHGLMGRIPLLEVRLFVVAVLLQRETGGNLSEILSKLATGVRERLRLRRQVKSASGQGRLTAMVLTCLPVATLIMLELVSPAYIDAMTDDPVGRNLLAAAVVSQILGYLAMQKIIRIEV